MNRKLSIALLISLIAISCTMTGLVVIAEASNRSPKFLLYKTRIAQVNEGYVKDLATRVFNIVTPSVNYNEGMYMVESYPLRLQVYSASGAFRYIDSSKAYNEFYKPMLPSKEEAKKIAESFLLKHTLLPKEARLKDASYVTTEIFYPETQHIETIVNQIDVVYGFYTPDGIPIEGAGSKITVSIGEKGEIIGVHWVWRNIEAYEQRPGLSQSKAIEKFREKLSVPVKLKVRLAYYSEPGFVEQEYLEPYYIFDYEATVHEKPLVSKSQKMPATISSSSVTSESLLSNAFMFSWALTMTTFVGLAWTTRKKAGLIASLAIALVCMSAFTAVVPFVNAQPNDDSLNTEVGIEWVCAYPAYKGPLQHCDEDARGFRDQLVAIGWTSRFEWSDGLAWEEDFKYLNAPGGGTDYVWADSVDFAYFSGHGSVADPNDGLIWFSVNYDYQSFNSNNARWGGTSGGSSTEAADLEWIVLDACLTLKETHKTSYDVFQRWDQAFCGLHYILGFHTVAYDTGNQGPRYGSYLRSGSTVRDAWVLSTQEVQPSDVWAAYLRAGKTGADTYYDRINPYSVSADPYPYSYLAYSKWQC